MSPKATSPSVPRVDPAAIKQAGTALLLPLQGTVQTLLVRTEDEYQGADQVLGRIRQARKTWADKMEPIIRPIRQGLDNLYALNREVDKPLELMEGKVKGAMQEFKRLELAAIREQQRLREAETARLQAEAEAKIRAAETARTPQMQGKLQAQAARASEQAEMVAQMAAPAPVRAVSSSTRTVTRYRVNMAQLIKGIVDGYVPPQAVELSTRYLDQQLKDDPEGLKAWPGVDVYEDVQIVGR